MKRFTDLYFAMDRTTRTNEKVDALAAYLRDTPARDAAWAVFVLMGQKIGRRVPTKLLRQWAAETCGLPLWLVEECHALVGDLAETLSLLTGPVVPGADPPPLHEIIEQVVLPLPDLPPRQQKETMQRIWSQLNVDQRLVFHKLLSGNFRVGVSRQLLVRALAEVAQVEPPVIAHRLAGKWNADEPSLARLLSQTISHSHGDECLPYPFMLAHPLQEKAETLGNCHDWLIDWKWDGIRAQIVRRAGKTSLWSRGDEMIKRAFPEIISCAADLPPDIVLDGELVAWHPSDSKPMPFTDLQTRINRKHHDLSFWPEVPVKFIAFDLLELERRDLRSETLSARREHLERIVAALPGDSCIVLSPLVNIQEWEELDPLIEGSRQRGVEGVMLKRLDSTYRPGRHAGLWWKLKIAPYTLDTVLIAAEPGRGKRAGLLTDYTFGVWSDGELVSIAKAYSGLTDEEIARVDALCRRYTTVRYGPVHMIEPRMVFELGFEAIQKSDRHKSGIALRFPRILRIRQDKKPQDADTLASVRALLATAQAR